MRTNLAWITLFVCEACSHKIRKSVTPGLTSSYHNTTTSAASSDTTSSQPSAIPASIPATQSQPTCVDTVTTYTGAVPQTVYVTVSSGYDVPVTASNAPVTAPTIYETPQQACQTVLVSAGGAPGAVTLSGSMSVQGPISSGHHVGPLTESTGSLQVNWRATTTVTVTKKTPIGSVVSTTVQTMSADKTNIGPSLSGSTSPGLIPFMQSPGSTADGPTQASGSGPSSKTSQPIQTSVVVGGVSISVGSSSVVVGSQTVTLPSSSQQTIVVGSQTLTLNPSQIIAPGTTYQIQRQPDLGPTMTQEPLTISTAGVTIVIGSTAAVVAGTTYRIGPGAMATTLTVNGQTIGIGSSGVAFSGAPPTTVPPEMTIVGGRELVIASGLTVAINPTEAVISGTTFRIGPGATATVVTIGGQTLTIGPSGVALPQTTIPPTSIPTITAAPKASSASSAQKTSSDEADQPNTGWSIQQSHSPIILTFIVFLIPGILTLL